MTRFFGPIAKVSDGEMTEFKENLAKFGFTAEDLRGFNKDPKLLEEWIEAGRELFTHESYKPFDSCPTHQWREVADRPDVAFMLDPQFEPWYMDSLKIKVRQTRGTVASIVHHRLLVSEWISVADGVSMRKKYPHHLNIEIRLRRSFVQD